MYGVAWRLAILVIPWQTRWFHDAALAGWPWEQGRWSVYGSWGILLAAIITSLMAYRRPTDKGWFDVLAGVGALSFFSFLAARDTASALSTVSQWWIQIILLGAFVYALWRARASSRDVAAWFVFALLPHAFLALLQYATQHVAGSAWLGMAGHLPETPGVSVVAHDGVRLLRAYGGLPHPNILGGWMAVGWIVSVWLAEKQKAWIAASVLCSLACVVTYSRSAWLGVAVGFVLMLARRAYAALRTDPKKTFLATLRSVCVTPVCLALCCSSLAFASLAFSQRAHVFTRVRATARLEAKSIDVRADSVRRGWRTFLRHPWIGTGPNAELVDVAQDGPAFRAEGPWESPHAVPLLVLVNLGLLGIILLVVLGVRNRHVLRNIMARPIPFALMGCLLVLGLFDHYLWSFWSGQTLVAMVAALAATEEAEPAKAVS